MKDNRYNFVDNLRWTVVLLVLVYHVFYNYNALGVFGGIGGFADRQWQDVVCTMLHPWFMVVLFVVAGASSKWALDRQPAAEWRRGRTRKLLVPSTVGLFAFGWVLGMINMSVAGADIPAEVPGFVRYIIGAVSGTAHLWFLQDLFLFSLLLLVARRLLSAERVGRWVERCSEGALWCLLIAVGVAMWGVAQSHIDSPSPAMGLVNLYRPLYYFAAYLVGYYLFASECVHSLLARRAGWLAGAAGLVALSFGWRYWGVDYTAPEVVQSAHCNLYVWIMVLAMVGVYARWAGGSSRLSSYLSRSSFGVYVVHMTVCTAVCLALRGCALPLWVVYAVALVVTFVGSFVLYEVLRRIPVLSWCIFGATAKGKK